MELLAEGDVVQLKSGGPKMTIESIRGREVRCVWFQGVVRRHDTFEDRVLTKRLQGTRSTVQP